MYIIGVLALQYILQAKYVSDQPNLTSIWPDSEVTEGRRKYSEEWWSQDFRVKIQ